MKIHSLQYFLCLFFVLCVTASQAQWYNALRGHNFGQSLHHIFRPFFPSRRWNQFDRDVDRQKPKIITSPKVTKYDQKIDPVKPSESDESGPLPTLHVAMSKFVWPDGRIPYKISHPKDIVRRNFKRAIAEVESKTCVRFVPYAGERDYIDVVDGRGCSSHVGRRGGHQILTLGRGCSPLGTIIHEMVHAIGFYHLQQKHDRDNHLDIIYPNIEKGKEHNFDVLPAKDKRVDKKFDYNSIMIYSSRAFGKDGKKTMIPKERGVTLYAPYDKTRMTKSDAKSVNRLYRCHKTSRS